MILKNLSGLKEYRVPVGMPMMKFKEDDYNGAFNIELKGDKYNILISNDGGWEHASISLRNKMPDTKAMNTLKQMFFEDDETVMQLHPPKSEYISNHQYCLHLWRPTKKHIPLPEKSFFELEGQTSRQKLKGDQYVIKEIITDEWKCVLINHKHKIPSWKVMCLLKDMFFEDYEAAMQLHLPNSYHSALKPNQMCLLRPLKERVPFPPNEMVGVKGVNHSDMANVLNLG